jgi:hypothetical protein
MRDGETIMTTYNLFRSRSQDIVCCAVPEDRAVPLFLTGATWEFCGKIEQPRAAPVGFDADAATYGVRFNGFYLFQDYSAP